MSGVHGALRRIRSWLGAARGSTLIEVLVAVVVLGSAMVGFDRVYMAVTEAPMVVAQFAAATDEAASGMSANQQLSARYGWQWWWTWPPRGQSYPSTPFDPPDSLGGLPVIGGYSDDQSACADLDVQCGTVTFTQPDGTPAQVTIVAPSPVISPW